MIDPKYDARALAAETCAVILAAGLGSRLGSNTKERPKCMVPIAGAPILGRMVNSLDQHQVNDFIIAVGYLADQIRSFVEAKYPRLGIRFVENSHFASTGSVYSLDISLDALGPNRNILLVEADVMLDPELIGRTFKAAYGSRDAATLLAPYEPSLSGTFALVEEGLVSAWKHESVRAADFPLESSFKTVNITFVRKGEPLAALRDSVKRAIADFGSRAPLEYAMQDLVTKGVQIVAVETDGLRWIEVDTPEDRAIAEGQFAPPESLMPEPQLASGSPLPAASLRFGRWQ